MVYSGMKKFMDALKTSKIKNFQVFTAPGTSLYNNDRGVIVLDENEEMLLNFTKNNNVVNGRFNGSSNGNGKIGITAANLADVHECRVACSYVQAKEFIKNYGISLDDEQMKIILEIDSNNYDLNPPTGDYQTSSFKYLTEDELSELSEDKKKEYQEALKTYELEQEKKRFGNRAIYGNTF